MKFYRIILFLFAALLAPVVASAVNVTITNFPAPIAGFHPVFNGGSDAISSFSINSGSGAGQPFRVTVGKNYDVTQLVNGVPTKIGTVSWNASGVGTFVPTP